MQNETYDDTYGIEIVRRHTVDAHYDRERGDHSMVEASVTRKWPGGPQRGVRSHLEEAMREYRVHVNLHVCDEDIMAR